MDTGNDTAASALLLPDTIGELGGLAPEAIIMRVVCRGLVLPHYVEPTREWLNAQVSPAPPRFPPTGPCALAALVVATCATRLGCWGGSHA